MLKRVGKKRDPLKPKKGAKKRWSDDAPRTRSKTSARKPSSRSSGKGSRSSKGHKPFDKEKMLKKVGKKRDPLKPKKGAKKRWAKD